MYPLHAKSGVKRVFLQFQSFVERLFDKKIKCVQIDWGGEYRPLAPLFRDLGIIFHHPCLTTHQQNGKAEHKYHHTVELGLTLLGQAHMLLSFWWDAFPKTTFIINLLSTSPL